MTFTGAKLALFIGAQLLVLRRDDRADIPWPGRIDLPGGGREGAETPVACVLRETREEVGLWLQPSDLSWRRRFGRNWFFAAHLPAQRGRDVVFGDEGQGWWLTSPRAFIVSPQAVPHFRPRLAAYLRHRARVAPPR
ncbi:NUDIX domain-containing protein [Aquicoccus sp. SCR17]|nr:NUDIX domain-containing protein [Carideicomes alvinocaridis]